MIKLLSAERHEKGWGYELWLVNNEKYCGKRLIFHAGKRFSFHYHKKKHEHFYVVKGSFILRTSWEDDWAKADRITLVIGDVVEIPPGLRHQLVALQDSEIIEISTQHFEDDSFRVVRGD